MVQIGKEYQKRMICVIGPCFLIGLILAIPRQSTLLILELTGSNLSFDCTGIRQLSL
jgi:hypothetical protein